MRIRRTYNSPYRRSKAPGICHGEFYNPFRTTLEPFETFRGFLLPVPSLHKRHHLQLHRQNFRMLQAPSQTPDTTPKITRGHSCILCQQRKVKCDRQKPCSNCIKARAECIPSAPLQPRRRKRKLTEIDLAARLRKYEHLLRTHGVKIDHDDEVIPGSAERANESPHWHEPGANGLSMNVPRARNVERGALFADKESSHYVEKYEPDISLIHSS